MTNDWRSKLSILGSTPEKNTFGNFLQENEILMVLRNSATTGHLYNFWEKGVRLHEIYGNLYSDHSKCSPMIVSK